MSRGDDHRLVALRLHGLADGDRRWLLSRLADTDRIKLEGYLQELKGFELDRETLAELEAHVAIARRPDSASKALEVSVAAQVLAAEPLWLSRVLRPEGFDHRIEGRVTVLTPRVRSFIENAFRAKVVALSARPLGGNEPVTGRQSYPVNAGSMWMRLRQAWRP